MTPPPEGRPKPPRMALLRPFTTRIVNPLTRRVAGWLPGFLRLMRVNEYLTMSVARTNGVPADPGP